MAVLMAIPSAARPDLIRWGDVLRSTAVERSTSDAFVGQPDSLARISSVEEETAGGAEAGDISC